MRIHSDLKISRIRSLRKRGYSINDIVAALKVPRTTVWHHVHEIKLNPQKIALIKSKQGGSKRIREINLITAEREAIKLLSSTNREMVIILAMLHWAEGSKKVCEFINSDGRMLAIYLHIVRNILQISEDKITPTMRIFTGMNEKECLHYWSSITKISKKKFRIRMNDGGTSGKTRYGMCRITINKGGNTLKLIHALINGVIKEISV